MSKNLFDASNVDENAWHLQGNWAPVKEELTVSELEIKGEVPKEINGLYIRNGMNPRSGYSDHWFFGNGMLHGFNFENGKVSYKNRYVRTPYYENDLDIISSFGDLSASPANTHIIKHADKFLALEEAHLPWEVDENLETKGVYNFSGKLEGAMTAHPRICPKTGELLFFSYSMMSESYLTYYRANPEGKLVQIEPIELPRAVMMHDWNITENHVVFMDLPIISDMNLAVETGSPFGFKPEFGARLGVMPREGSNSDVKWFDIDPCYVFHPLNSYEEGNKIILYVCRQEEAMVGGFQDIYGGDTTVARLWKWTIDLELGVVKEEQIDDAPCDFPRVDDRRIGFKNDYGYCTTLDTEADSLTIGRHLLKYDLAKNERLTHDLGKNVTGGEALFVPRSSKSTEDDGWVVSLAYEAETNRSKLLVINSQDFESDPVAEIYAPQRVPNGAHGSWISKD
jgi:carotenoid cleavage dioxygenase